MKTTHSKGQIYVRPLRERDLDEADRILQLAFGTFNAAPNPESFMGDRRFVHTRWRANPQAAFAAESDGRLVGSNFATRWGRFGFFGPLSIDPAFWDLGFASDLIAPVMELFKSWKVRLAGLFTFAHSVKHIGLYQKFGFRPRALTLILEKNIRPNDFQSASFSVFSKLDQHARREALVACRQLTEAIYDGLDVGFEIESIYQQALGDTVLVRDVYGLKSFAACHIGPGSEAGSGICYVKFAAAAPGPETRIYFSDLLKACEVLAWASGASQLVAGVNAARREAYEEMLLAGFQMVRTGIAMHRPNDPGFNRSGVFVMDDWR